MKRSGASAVRQSLMATAAIGCIPLTTSWPGPQWIFHALLVLGLAPSFQSPVVSMLWAGAAGWVLEGTQRFHPHMGGTALADMTLCLLVRWTLTQWPSQGRNAFLVRMAVFTLALALVVHLAVRVAAGPHAWGSGLLWALVTVPLWGTLAHRNLRPVRS